MNPYSYFMYFFPPEKNWGAASPHYTDTQPTRFCCVFRQLFFTVLAMSCLGSLAISAVAQPCALQIDYETYGDCYGDTPCVAYQYSMQGNGAYNTDGFALRLPNFPMGEQNFIFAPNAGATQYYFIDGDWRIVGTLISATNPNKRFHIDLWLDNKQTWATWNAMNPSFADQDLYRDESGLGAVGASYTTWSFFTIDATKPNTLTGEGDYVGYTLHLNHNYGAPAHHYGFQLGADGANNFNNLYGMSGLVQYTATAQAGYTVPSYMTNGNGEVALSVYCPPKQCTGSLSLVATGGTAPYTYAWDNGMLGSELSGLCADIYTVTVSDAAGCTATRTTTIGFVANPQVYLGPDRSYCTNTATIDGTTMGATFYQWNTGDNTPTISVSASGTYSVTVSNSSGCTSTDAVYIEFSPLSVELGSNQISCSSIALNAGSGYATYWWNTGATTASIIAPTTGLYSVTVTNAEGCTASDAVSLLINTPTFSLGSDITTCQSSVALSAPSGMAAYAWSSGQTTPDIIVNGSGTYSVTVTNADGCTASDAIVVAINNTTNINLGNDITACQNATLVAPAGFASYSWSNGQTTAAITAATSGTYSVTVTTAAGCTASDAVGVTIANNASVNLGSDYLVCTPTTLIAAPSGFATYAWNTGAITQSITVNSTATYTVTVTTAAGCTASDNVKVTFLPIPSVNLGSDQSSCNPVSLYAGAGFTTYTWSNGATSPGITVLSSGTYSVTVSNAAGCTASDAVMVTIFAPLSVNLGNDISTCNATATLDATTPFATYQWSTGSNMSSISVSSSGTYSVTVTGQGGCTASDAINVNLIPIPDYSLGSDVVACNSTTLNAGSGFTNYLWTNGATTQSITVSTSGNYGVSVTTAAGCTMSDFVYVSLNNSGLLDLGSDIGVCGSTVLDAGTAYSEFMWNTGATTQTLSVTTSGIYSVTASNVLGCTASDQVFVTVFPSNLVEFGDDIYSCAGVVVLDAAQPFGTYQWSTGETTPNISVTQSGSYSVTVTGQGNCVDIDQIDIIVSSPPAISLGSDFAACNNAALDAGSGYASYLWNTGATIQDIGISNSGTYSVTVSNATGCTASDAVNVSIGNTFSYSLGSDITACSNALLNAGGGYTSYLWSTGATTSTIAVSNSGTYSVTVTNLAECTASDAIDVTIGNTFSYSLGNDITACGSASLDAGSDYTAYLWNTGASTQNISATNSGIYSVTVTNATGCTASDAIAVAIGSSFPFSLGNDITACGSATLAAGMGYTAYNWSTGATWQGITVTESGTYSVTVTNSAGCTASDAVAVNLGNTFAFSLGNDVAACNSTTLNAGSGYTSYNWSTGATWQAITVTESGIYGVTVTDAAGCIAADAVVVNIGSSIAFSLGNDVTACGSTFINAGGAYSSYLWNTGATTSGIAVSNSGTYSVTVTNSAGCTAADAVIVSIGDSFPFSLGNDVTACGSTFINAGGAYSSYLWNTGATTSGITVSNSGTYSVTVTNSAGCTAADAVIVSINSGGTSVNLGADISLSEGDLPFTISASNGFANYAWSTGAVGQSIIVNSGGTYSVTVTDAAGCTASDDIIITVVPNSSCNTTLTTAIGSATAVCNGSTISLSVGVVNGDGGTLTWYDQNGNAVPNPNSVVLTTSNCEGQVYSFTPVYTPTTAGCPAVSSNGVPIVVYPDASGNVTGENCIISLAGICANFGVSWFDNLGNAGTGNTYTAQAGTGGLVTFTLLNYGAQNAGLSCATQTYVQAFNCNPDPCAGNSPVLSAATPSCVDDDTFSVMVSANGGSGSYTVTGIDLPPSGIVLNAGTPISLNYTANGSTYTLTAQDNATGCLSNILSIESPNCSPGGAPIAVNDVITLCGPIGQTIDVLANDLAGAAAIEGIFSLQTVSGGGTAVLTAGGLQVFYEIGDNSEGTDVFNYTVIAVDGQISNTATITVIRDCPDVAGTISGFVWNDANGNGIQNVGESGISFASVTLYTAAGAWVASATTNFSGFYSFGGLATGDYYVSFSTPTGFGTVAQGMGGNPAADSDYNPATGQSSIISINGNTVDIDAGFAPLPSGIIAQPDCALTAVNAPVTIDVLANDLPSSGLTIAGVSIPNAQINFTNTITYYPPDGFEGIATFNYTVSTDGGTATGSITVQVGENNQAPNTDTYYACTAPMIPVDVCIALSDPDGDDLYIASGFSAFGAAISVLNDTCVRFTPLPGFSGVDTAFVTICDDPLNVCGGLGIPQCAQSRIIVTVACPDAVNDTDSTLVGTPITIPILNNDSGYPPLTITITDQPDFGTVVIVGNQIIYTPAAGNPGVDVLEYTITDPNGNSDNATVTIYVLDPNNQAPVANNDFGLLEDGDEVVFISVLVNDFDPNGDPIEIIEIGQPACGISTDFGDEVIYIACDDFPGIDSFYYIISDPNGFIDTAWVIISNTNPTPDVVIAADDSDNTTINTPVNVFVTLNDTACIGGICLPINAWLETYVVSINIVAPPANGSAVALNDGLDDYGIVYTPNSAYTGTDQFTYEICVTGVGCDIAVVSIDVFSPPYIDADDDIYTTNAGVPINLPIIANDSICVASPVLQCIPVAEVPIGVISMTVLDSPNLGEMVYDALTNSFNYVPTATGIDTFTYEVCVLAPSFTACDTAMVIIYIGLCEDEADAQTDVAFTTPTQSVAISVLGNDLGTALSINSTTPAQSGTVAVSGNQIIYTPNAGISDTSDFFFYTISDTCGNTATTLVGVNILYDGVNHPPTAGNDVASTNPNSNVVIDLTANDSDPDGDDISITTVNDPANGTATNNNDGTITYLPDTDFVGIDCFDYIVCDTGGLCDTATVCVSVDPNGEPSNNPPVAINDETTTQQGVAVLITQLSNDFDPDGDIISTTTIATPPANGTSTQNGDGTITYTPYPDFVGTDYIQYIICDNGTPILCDTAWITIIVTGTPTNNPPVATDDYAEILPEDTLTLVVTSNDFDPDGDPFIVVTISDQPNHGLATILDGNSIGYVPLQGYIGCDTLQYVIQDQVGGGTDTATVVICISTDPNDPPIAVDDLAEAITEPIIIDFLGNDFDPDGEEVRLVSIISGPQYGTVALEVSPDDTLLLYLPPVDTCGLTDTIVYVIEDPEGLTDTAIVVITVLCPLNNPPIAVDDNATTTPNTTLVIPILSNDTDPDGDVIVIVDIINPPANGTAQVIGTDSISYTPNPDFIGCDTLSYVITDGELTDTALVVICTGNPPIAVNDTVLDAVQGIPYCIEVLGNDTDPDGDDLTIADINTLPFNGTAVISDSDTCLGIVYTADTSFVGIDSFQYVISTPDGLSDTAWVFVVVADDTQTEDTLSLVAIDDNGTTPQNTPLVINVGLNDLLCNTTTEPPICDPLANITCTDIIVPPLNGTIGFTDPLGGMVEYIPNTDFVGVDSFQYVICAAGLTDTATVVIDVTADEPACETEFDDIFIPSGFSPNGDGKNDRFVIPEIATCYPDNEFLVFNRWGDRVFRALDYNATNAWDGTWENNGEPVPDHTYFYVLINAETQEKRNGCIELRR